MTSRAVFSTRAVSTPAKPPRRAAAPRLPEAPASSMISFFPLVLVMRASAPGSAMEAGAKPRATARLLLHGE